jgi:trans-aconitate methyltransferase
MPPDDPWTSGQAYERYVGRWSRPVAREFIHWLEQPAGLRWFDAGCGTAALTQTILENARPSAVHGVDRSSAFVTLARSRVQDPSAAFIVADATRLPARNAAYQAVVSGLVLNFLPDPVAAIREWLRVLVHDGVLAVYVWDYDRGMQMMRIFWDAAVALDPDAATVDESARFSLCNPTALTNLLVEAGGTAVGTRSIEVETRFSDFDDYWQPFLAGTGPAPAYVASLDEPGRSALRERIRAALPFAADGSIPLRARAWAARAQREGAR